VYRFGTLAPKQWEGLKVLNLPEPEIGEKVGPVRLTEPDHSSDPGLMTTRAEKECS
jgi:alkylation response protein AidB-like acyl-CoA dehydrogenase